MSNMQTGGPAFPSSEWDGDYQRTFSTGGMTLRDYFAAKAMQAIVSHPNTGGMTYEDISDRAWVQADAMLKARDA
jgi:hypothetical protein